MGTRADFYIGTGPTAEWLGSCVYDGYPDGNGERLIAATSEDIFRMAVAELHDDPDVRTVRPEQGWPWPWEDSRTTDYAYAWDAQRGAVMSVFGRRWITKAEHEENMKDEEKCDAYSRSPELRDDEVVNMKSREMDTAGKLANSGLIIVGG